MPSRRRRARTRLSRQARSMTTAILLIALIVILYSCNQIPLLDDLFSEVPGPVSEEVVSGEWYSLYFTEPTQTRALDNPSGGIPAYLAASIDEAQTSVDVAVYEFDLMPLAEALLRAAERGVRVRLVTDSDAIGEEPVQALLDAGIPVVDDQREAIMHDKFVVIDRSVVWTGSMNFTRNDAYRNNNSFIRLDSTRLAENYTREFEEMFTGRAFGPTSPANTPHPAVTLDGTLIENYFSPEDGVAVHIAEVLESAQASIHFMAFSFTRQDLAEVLLDKAAAGVSVQGVFETRQIAAGGDQAWNLLTTGGLDVRQDGNPYNLHSKVFIVDGEAVVLGSYNFSRNAEERNDENVLIIHNPEIARAYLDEWQEVWAEAGGR